MIDRFQENLEKTMSPNLSAKDMVQQIVRSALEAEFGTAFTRSKGFDKMVSTIADTIVANPDLRRESLSIASRFIERKVEITKSPKAEDIKPQAKEKGYGQKNRPSPSNPVNLSF
jgi:hypothetical protein